MARGLEIALSQLLSALFIAPSSASLEPLVRAALASLPTPAAEPEARCRWSWRSLGCKPKPDCVLKLHKWRKCHPRFPAAEPGSGSRAGHAPNFSKHGESALEELIGDPGGLEGIREGAFLQGLD